MIRFLIYLFITLFIAFKLNAENLSKIKVDGNKRVSEETIKVYGNIQIGKDYQEEDLDIVLKKLYETEFLKK